jgi:ATP-dependent helicase/nuclease subunit A
MGKGTLTIYSASAGSGKTYALTRIYLTNLFKSRFYYRKILAVTFTNKATAEMKSRILENLYKLATGGNSDYIEDLIRVTKKPESWIRSEAKGILRSILHDYSRFSVSTIDVFFQKLLRAFAREIGLHPGFDIELDYAPVLSSAIDEMMQTAVSDKQLREWLKEYSLSRIEEEKSWNLKDEIFRLSEELFKERFKILSAGERSKLENKDFLLRYIEKLRSIRYSFKNNLQNYGKTARELYQRFGLSDEMFYRKGQGIPGFIKSLLAGDDKEPNSYVREILNDPPRWSTGNPSSVLIEAIEAGLGPTLTGAIKYYYENIRTYRSAVAILERIYTLGILTDILSGVRRLTNLGNIFLLSDAGELLNLITSQDQTLFIYEKAGNRYENFMIDEFQDTSLLQWSNFRPLIDNSMSEGSDNYIVGDVKQSIYRWRNSDWQILGKELPGFIDDDRFISRQLNTNWRSRSNIIRFNNRLFSVIPALIDEKLSDDAPPEGFRQIYAGAVQADPGNKEGGYIRIEFLENDDEAGWQQKVLEKLPQVIESLEDNGYSAGDIGIIVRDGKEGAMVLKTLIDYGNNRPDDKRHYNFNVISNDSLLLSGCPAIVFIIAALTVINDPDDILGRAVMLRYYLLAHGDDNAGNICLISDKLTEVARSIFPQGYETFLESVRDLSLFETTESIVEFFRIGKHSGNVAYINTFQDYILSYSGNKNSDIQSFLEWWETTGCRKSVVLPVNHDAIRILTIHKSKGLEFKIVISIISWNLDHPSFLQPVLWVKPDSPPFNELGIVPVKYGRNLASTIFAKDYREEKCSSYLDNLNLLYVAFTRAKDVLIGFSADYPGSDNTVAGVLKSAFAMENEDKDPGGLNLNAFYDSGSKIFEYGNIPVMNEKEKEYSSNVPGEYLVNKRMDSLRLKLGGEDYFLSSGTGIMEKVNYGKMMHEIFENIKIRSDVPAAVKKLVIDGRLPVTDSEEMVRRIDALISRPPVEEWFMPGNEIITETTILLPSGKMHRPDRVILRDGKAIVVDFKFGEEKNSYAGQLKKYRSLLEEMGYTDVMAYIWYVDINKIITVYV